MFLMLLIVGFKSGVDFLNYIYMDWSELGRALWHSYYNEKENIDYLYLGSSHVYRGVNPFRLDELNGGNNFNMASSSQFMNGSYYLLKEVEKHHNIKHVYLDMYYAISNGEGWRYKDRPDTVHANQWNTDFMKFSWNKLQYIFSMSKPSMYSETIFPFIRYRSCLYDYNYIKNLINKKEKYSYQNYIYADGDGYYTNKGYWYYTVQLPQNKLIWKHGYKMEQYPMADEAEKYLRMIIEYCQKNNVGITLFGVPSYELEALATENYDNYVEQIRQIASEYGIDYYDFNLCKEGYLPIQEPQNFSDINHLNANGALIFTETFYQVMSNTPEENEKYFYSSYAEKLQSIKPQIYGIYQVDFDSTKLGIDAVAYKVASNRPDDMEYRILLTPDNGGTRMYQEFSSNSYFSVPENEHGICTIVARVTGQEDEVQTLEIEY